ncbi:MAG TPA: 30S ribosomal protein S9 [Acidimicrobiales bacterium]|nr:30S ribosomal protein S9 [Acidimicrobiales bacterium]
MSTKPLVQATGRRKRAIARVMLRPGTGTVTINGKDVKAYFPTDALQSLALAPLAVAEAEEHYDVQASIIGGGTSGQAGAMSLGLARALAELDPERRSELKGEGLLRRDPRKKESKKYGLKKARKAPQYSKR